MCSELFVRILSITNLLFSFKRPYTQLNIITWSVIYKIVVGTKVGVIFVLYSESKRNTFVPRRQVSYFILLWANSESTPYVCSLSEQLKTIIIICFYTTISNRSLLILCSVPLKSR